MKLKLPVGVCALISLALVLIGLGYGTVSGFNQERRQVTDLVNGENGLNDVLSYRGADGLNLCVVAQRHLAEDGEVETLRQTAQTLTRADESLKTRLTADAELDGAVAAVKARLEAAASYDQRDKGYVAMLESDLTSLKQNDLAATYEKAANAFNQKLSATPMGFIASFLGVKPCESMD